MTADHPKNLARIWLRYQNLKQPEDLWSLNALSDMIHRDFQGAWAVIRQLCEFAKTVEEYCSIGSGPIEDLVRVDGARAVMALEDLVDDDPSLAVVAACVWAWNSPYRWRIDRLLEKHEQPRL